ncbi:MAG: polymer-forming cytoskeletal protein [Oscillospiraceae bacterium]|jgi:cytoskeletal protein CcmA (bactofilin family)|nr:polymer-forming cytoskeletal protein [Oscillospiraceae bacterium]MCI8715795.1 polymer-forming cytoskeletal protein [Oscillospiraceae bacterium]MCI9317648.1 polymer-forming cytoskeletal protein [Oscillospiraceae bacterium]MDE6935477.1 polymer-forming cytoskeletal protein [Oscillospiraceae bacterium]
MAFWKQAKADVDVEPVEIDTQEQYDELPSLPTPLSSTVIATGVTMSGTLRGEGVIQVEGIVEGEIDLKGAVIVTPTGHIKGPVAADTVHIAGCIMGDVMARDHMRLEKTGSLEGDVTTVSLVVEDGGHLNGRSNMLKGEKAPGAPANNLKFGSNYKGETPAES